MTTNKIMRSTDQLAQIVFPKAIKVTRAPTSVMLQFRPNSYWITHIVRMILFVLMGIPLLWFGLSSANLLVIVLGLIIGVPTIWSSIYAHQHHYTRIKLKDTMIFIKNHQSEQVIDLANATQIIIRKPGDSTYTLAADVAAKSEQDRNDDEADTEKHLLSGIGSLPIALSIETIIEDWLDINDIKTSADRNLPTQAVVTKTLAIVARRLNLMFFSDSYPHYLTLSGEYQGCSVNVHAECHDPSLQKKLKSHLKVRAIDQQGDPQPLSANKIIDLLPRLTNSDKLTVSSQKVEQTISRELYFTSTEPMTNIRTVESQLNRFANLLSAYPQIIVSGGDAITTLQPIAQDSRGSLSGLAHQLISDICQTTHHLRSKVTDCYCRRCLARFQSHVGVSRRFQKMVYYGCRICQQSNDYFIAPEIITVLDRGMNASFIEGEGALRVHWLASKRLHDFDQVEVIQATDKEVEQFAMMLGNDTDSVRRTQYAQAVCTISPDCDLSENTIRILKRTFAQVI
ncbi:MAG: hypothetical protein AAF629_04270 [Chloroflexota bacterium]